ncbi:MAG: ArsR family transcriptional regulator [Candidatus Aenigmarchaeota archaeon]|nr:ArsR family transcriptional regulator [Candidatus Aenigmarchaeota archaeon]
MTILIVTVGEKKEPLYEGIKQSKKKKKIYYLATKETENVAVSLCSEFRNLYDSDIVIVDPESFCDIVSSVVEILRKEGNNVILFNITGGTKLMSLACYSVANLIGSSCFYIHKCREGMKKFILPIIQIPEMKYIGKNKRKFQILELLSGKPYSLTELTIMLKLRKPTVIGHLKKLEGINLVERCNIDRNQILQITESGRIVIKLFGENK